MITHSSRPKRSVRFSSSRTAPFGRFTGLPVAYPGASAGYSRLRSNYKYPAPGSRGFTNGTLSNIGENGYSWSSSIDGGNAHYLFFSDSGITPQYMAYRASGLPVRCLLE